MKAHTRCLTKTLEKKTIRKKKESTPGFEPSTLFCEGVQSTFEPHVSIMKYLRLMSICTYEYTREILRKKRKQHSSQGDNASTAGVAPGRVGRDEHGEARRANTTPNGGPHLELERVRLTTLSKSDSWIAETTWPTYLYEYLYVPGH